MVKSFNELGKRAKELLSEGEEADQNVQACSARVSSAKENVASARSKLADASRLDENGIPEGDVEQARAELNIANNQLQASQRALSAAKEKADRVKDDKNSHIQEIQEYRQVEKSNLEKLRELRSKAFGEVAVALTDGIAQRLNEAEKSRVELARSMGGSDSPEYISLGGGGGEGVYSLGLSHNEYSVHDTSKNYSNAGFDMWSSGGGLPTPAGGGLGPVDVESSERGIANNANSLDDIYYETDFTQYKFEQDPSDYALENFVKTRGNPMTFEQADSGHVNPNFDPSSEYDGYRVNCQTCVVAFEARQRGYDVEARPRNTDAALDLSCDPSLAWIDPRTNKKPEYIYNPNLRDPQSYLNFVKETVKPGQRYTIQVLWDDDEIGGGHIVNIDRDLHGELRIKDNQVSNKYNGYTEDYNGDSEVLQFLQYARYDNADVVPKLLRIDNMKFNAKYVTKILKGVRGW